ncbi:MAG: HEPN domain-containing protein [candidate division NC10 bacterium]|nr:HEPN domain-containing protein [candidate division NC10 bacterium]
MRRYKDWLRQAKRKLQSAEWDLQGGFYEDACFSAQQAAELAAKALAESRRRLEVGHSVLAILQSLEDTPSELERAARVLDRYYIPTRYPNNWPAGAPMDYYDEETAREAIAFARLVIEYVEGKVG